MYNAGLILEGGGMRGVYTAGVLDAFLDAGIEFSSVYGVSAVLCCCYGCRYWSRKVFKGTRSEKADVDDPRIQLSPVSI